MILKIANLISLLLAEAWFVNQPDWEPAILFIGLFAGLIAQEIKGQKSNDNKSEQDKFLFSKFLNDLPSNNGSIFFLSQHDFHNDFELSKLNQIRNFTRSWSNAEHEFLNKNLEKIRLELILKIDEFIYCSSMNTFAQGDGWQTSIPNYKEDGGIPESRQKSIAEMNDLSSSIVKKHQNLIRLSKNILDI